MRGIIIGLGSMGKRRIRLLRGFFNGIELCGVDTRADRRDDVMTWSNAVCYDSIETAIAEFAPEVAFVCTSPLSHAAITTQLLEAGLHIFSEINLVADGYAHNIALAKQKGLVLFLSSTPLYRREIVYIDKAVKDTVSAPLLYQYHVGQYLPDWHPWEDIHDYFVGDKRTNGCRELLAIELPWLCCAFGPVQQMQRLPHTATALDIDFADSYLVTLRHESGAAGQLLVDVVSRKAVRELTVLGEQLFLQWGGTPDSLRVYDIGNKIDIAVDTYERVTRDERYADNIIENAYVDELTAFFDTLAGKDVRRHTFEQDKKILTVIDQIEEVAP